MENEEKLSYHDFASVYDLFMEETPYAKWGDYIGDILEKAGIRDGLVLDLGCGTGSMTEYLAGKGYDMIGVDDSQEMLEAALEKKYASGRDILYLQQDMRAFELYGTVRAVVSVCDCVNYMTEPEDLLRVFRLVSNYLDPGGLFVFDFNTTEKYRQIGAATIAENREQASFIWENDFEEGTRINEYLLTLFIGQEDGSFTRCMEVHRQRGYETDEVRDLLNRAGLDVVACFDDYGTRPAGVSSTRVTVVARENVKAMSRAVK